MGNTRLSLPKKACTALHIADGQKPFQDHRTWAMILKFARECKPNFIINHGDDAECYHWSHWDKSPLDRPGHIRTWDADHEIAAVQSTWDSLREACPKSHFVYCLGNHEERVKLHYKRSAPEVQRKGDTFAKVFQVDRWWDTTCEFGYGVKLGHLWNTHGDTTMDRGGPGSAKRMLSEWGASVAFGHTHKAPFHIEAPKGELERAAFGIPCHCRRDPHYAVQPGWIHGFGLSTFLPSGRYSLQRIFIINYWFVFGHQLYKG